MFERKTRSLATIAALTVLTPAMPAAAGTGEGQQEAEAEAEARKLFREGDKLYAEGDYEGAVVAFEKAYELSKREALKYNMANAYERLGRYEAAIAALRDYLPHTKPEEQAVVRRRVEKLEKRVEDQRIKAQQAEVNSESSPPPAARSSAQARANASVDEGTPAPVLGYAMLGVGAVGLGVGTFFGLRALGDKSDGEGACVDSSRGRLCPSSAQAALDGAQSKALIADVSLGVGIVASALGAYLVLSTGPEKSASTHILRVSGGSHGGEVRLIGTF